MQELSEHRARPRMARALATAAALLCVTALGQPNPAYAGPHGGGGGGGFHGGGLAASMAADSMPDLAGFTGVGFTGASSTGAGSTGAGSTAIDFTIGDFSSVDRLQILGGAIIRTTTITTIANRTPPRPGITAPIRQAITPMWGSAIPAGKRFQVVDAWSKPLSRKAAHSAPRGFGTDAAGGRSTWRSPGRRRGVKRSEGNRSAADRLRRARLGLLALRRPRQPQPFAEVLALRSVH
jgi:hypothetical protein